MSRESIRYYALHQGVPQPEDTLLNKLNSPILTKRGPSVHIPKKPLPKACLAEIDLTGCWELDDVVLSYFLVRFPRLSVVKLGNIYSLTDSTMAGLARNTQQLELLDITGCWRISDQGINLVGEYNKHLNNISVRDCRDVTENSLGRLRQKGVM